LHAKPAFCQRARFELAAVERGPLTHADQALTAARRARERVRRVRSVANLDLQSADRVPDPDLRTRSRRVLANVGERLLQDPIGGEINTRREGARLSLDLDV